VESRRRISDSIQGCIVEPACIPTDAAGDIQLVESSFGQHKRSHIQLMIGWDDKLRSIRAVVILIHAVEPYRQVPVVELRDKIFDVVRIAGQLQIKTGSGIGDGMTELAAKAALEAQIHLQPAIFSQCKAVTGIDPIVLYMLM